MVEGGQVQLFLAMKIVIDHRHIDFRRLADPAHGGGLVAFVGKQVRRRLQDARARRFAFFLFCHANPII